MESDQGRASIRDRAGPLRRLAALAINLVFPPVCCGCGRLTGDARAVCPSCWAKIPLIERPYCEVLGMPFTFDPGEGAVSPEAIANPPVFDRLRSAAIHEGIVRDLVHGLKYRDRTDLAPMMAEWMIRAGDGAVAAADMIVPVPLHAFRLWRRKFNQAAELARFVAKHSARTYRPDVLRRTKRTSRQVGLGARAREANVRGAFSVPEGLRREVAGKRIVLVDDVYTTGATVTAAARALKRAGAGDVTVLTFAMAVSGPI
ncbi:ComF family protein [Sinorhizobium medicae]|uniref:Phosphoribosyltransferase n=2 Tax=Sinorhizobium medicae TaxID=110321 RepID=A0A508X1D6_9HYPH|nr:ComF family protein [Sinorhizobium medicae]ABR61340.1 phosphoribosyltransferase [Sinorhizobium medicae WSM419]MBO1943287.1 ComF family protein [Sinorhizobium medicae]MBO1958957.1 ComF family protein [Sinorhizobium medicae]MDX0405064.1 ComF family protein [Sinorhizobium medicae]MDX0410951.1 ComF family protein [Sinorhizobium medicae]